MSSEQQQVGVGRPATERSLSDADRRAIAEEGCIIRGLVGSTIHGLMLEGQDDRDKMAVAIEPPEAARMGPYRPLDDARGVGELERWHPKPSKDLGLSRDPIQAESRSR